MAKSKKNGPVKRFDYKIKGMMSGLRSRVGTRDDETSSFHDAFTVTANLKTEEMHEVLDAMGMSNTTFTDNLPDEAPTIELNPTFHDHSLKIRGGNRIQARMDGVTIAKFTVTKSSDAALELEFIVKGLPSLDEHFNLERLILDCHNNIYFIFEFGSPAQQDAFENEEAEENTPEAPPSNVTHI